MIISKKSLKQYMVLIVAFICTLLTLSISENMMTHIFVFIAFSAVPILLVKVNILHPYCWFSAFFCLYSVGHPIMYRLGFSGSIGYTKGIMIYQLIALFVALIVIGPKEVNYAKTNTNFSMKMDIGAFNKVILFILVACVFIATIYVSRSGFSGKEEIYDSGSSILRIIFRFPLIISLLYSMSVIAYYTRNNKLPKGEIICVSMALILITLFSGERDFIFRFLIINLLCLWFLKILKVKHLFIIVPFLVLLISLSSTYKYFFLRGTVSTTHSSILQSALSGEFESASRNLQVLINNSTNVKGIKGFDQLFLDIASVFDNSIKSSTAWFGDMFYPNSQTQYGFTLTGEGYIIAGGIGIVILFLLVGLIIKWFHRNSYKNLYSLSAYFYLITVIIYSIRADFSTILAAIIKQIGLVLLIVYICEKISKRRNS